MIAMRVRSVGPLGHALSDHLRWAVEPGPRFDHLPGCRPFLVPYTGRLTCTRFAACRRQGPDGLGLLSPGISSLTARHGV